MKRAQMSLEAKLKVKYIVMDLGNGKLSFKAKEKIFFQEKLFPGFLK